MSSLIGRDPGSRSFQLRQLLELTKSWAGSTGQVLLGSDFPLYSQDTTLAVIDELVELVGDAPAGSTPLVVEDVVAVRDRNAATFLSDLGILPGPGSG